MKMVRTKFAGGARRIQSQTGNEMENADMNQVAILTDTNSGITQAEADQIGVHLLAMPFYINGELFYEGVTLTQREFYQRLQANDEVSTSMPSPGDTMHAWDELLKEARAVLYIPMTSGLSSAVSVAKSLAQAPEYAGRVFVADNKRISATLRQAVYDAVLLKSRGLPAERICEELDRTAYNARILIMVDTLKYLKKSGRVTAAGAMLGDALGIKPVLKIEGGKLDAFKKVRGLRTAKEIMLEAVARERETSFGGDALVMTAYSGDPETGEEWNRLVREYFPGEEVYNTPLPLSIACHTGPGALGVGCVRPIQ